MAAGNLYVVEYADVYRASGAANDIPAIPVTNMTTLVSSSGQTSVQSGAFQSNTRVVGLGTDSSNAVCVVFGTNPVATTTSSIHIPASSPQQLFAIPQASSFKVAVIFSAT